MEGGRKRSKTARAAPVNARKTRVQAEQAAAQESAETLKRGTKQNETERKGWTEDTIKMTKGSEMEGGRKRSKKARAAPVSARKTQVQAKQAAAQETMETLKRKRPSPSEQEETEEQIKLKSRNSQLRKEHWLIILRLLVHERPDLNPENQGSATYEKGLGKGSTTYAKVAFVFLNKLKTLKGRHNDYEKFKISTLGMTSNVEVVNKSMYHRWATRKKMFEKCKEQLATQKSGTRLYANNSTMDQEEYNHWLMVLGKRETIVDELTRRIIYGESKNYKVIWEKTKVDARKKFYEEQREEVKQREKMKQLVERRRADREESQRRYDWGCLS